jgi:hypothetical protein
LLFIFQTVPAATTVSLVADTRPGRATAHGLEELRLALKTKGVQVQNAPTVAAATGDYIVVIGLPDELSEVTFDSAAPEALMIRKVDHGQKPLVVIGGSDDRGLMYGLLDVADRVGWATNSDPFSQVHDTREQPDCPDRALSIYTMQRAAFEQRFFDEKYWARYFDMLARDRFNSFVLIFGFENGGYFAPAYPWFFEVEGFPKVAVPNVTKEQQARNLRALNHLADLAHDRGLRFSVGLWDQIYRGGVQSGGMMNVDPNVPGPDRVWGLNQTNLFDYSRAALAKFLKLAPGIDGIQFRMHDESGLKPGKEQHEFWQAMFQAVKDQRPKLPLTLRAKGLPDDIIDLGLNMGLNVRVATKHWMEQVGLPFHPTHVPAQDQMNRRHGYADLLKYPQKYKIHWRLFSAGTIRVLLWGDPEFARRFADSTHLYNGDGFEVTEPMDTKMASQPHDEKPFDLLRPQYRYYEFEFERYWHFFQVFGRIGYNPNTPSEVWDHEFQQRLGSEAAPEVEQALHEAGWILPRINATDFPYKFFPMTRGWAEKQRWGDLPEYAKTAEGSDTQQFMGIDEAARNILTGTESAKLSPEKNSAWFAKTSRDVLGAVDRVRSRRPVAPNSELHSTLVDLEILAHLAGYHSQRILAGVNYALFKGTQNVKALDEAISHERLAVAEWEGIVKAAGDVYADDLKMGLRQADLCGSWSDELAALEKGLAAVERERRDFKPAVGGIVIALPARKSSTDQEAPMLQHVAVTNAPASQPLSITAKVSDSSGVKWVRLRYRSVTQYQDYETLAMQRVGDTDEYAATIPAAAINPKWDFMYFFEVMDNAGNGKIYPDFEKETPYVIVKLER